MCQRKPYNLFTTKFEFVHEVIKAIKTDVHRNERLGAAYDETITFVPLTTKNTQPCQNVSFVLTAKGCLLV